MNREDFVTHNANKKRYNEWRIQAFLAAVLCIGVFVGCWVLIVPEIYRLTNDITVAYTVTILIGLFVSHIIFNMVNE